MQAQSPMPHRNERGMDANCNTGGNEFSSSQRQQEYQYSHQQQHSQAAAGGYYPQQFQQQHQQLQQHSNNYSSGHHHPKIAMSSPQPLAPSRADRSPAYYAYNTTTNDGKNNNSSNNNNNNNIPPPTRTGRKLFQDPNDSLRASQRSRSNVRRTADRTQQLAILASNTDNSHDTMSDVGSVFSSFSGIIGGGIGGGGGGSGENNSLHHHQHRQSQSFHRQSSGNSTTSSSKSLSNSLDAFVSRSKYGNINHNYNHQDDENCSVVSGVSGAGSVAARRRAANMNRQYPPQQQHHQQQQHSGYNHGKGSISDFNAPSSTTTTTSTPIGGSTSKPRAIAPPPPQPQLHPSPASYSYLASSSPGAVSVASSIVSSSSSAAAGANNAGGSSARSRMRMRMQQQAATTSTSNATSGRIYLSSSQPGIIAPIMEKQPSKKNNTNRPSLVDTAAASADDDGNLYSDTIDHEVNLALSELKLSHPEIIDVDFICTISRLESGGSTGDGSCSSTAVGGGGIESGGDGGGGGVMGSSSGSSSVKGGGVGFKKTTTTTGAAISGRISPHTVSTKSMTIMNSTVVDPPTASSTAVTTNATTAGQNALISPVISVEQYSESSVHQPTMQGVTYNNSRCSTSDGSNIFKDTERMGSTLEDPSLLVDISISSKIIYNIDIHQ